ncbi:siderophore-interacting protein [Mesorhizobium sp. CO1-1-8]|uniref:siderophore-interacting protein n=1 Tax=Mesorhizobium sp. CO1-1-8 TaxID=2876631 RepID=UPI001CD07F04|nr:siderophore-interacting protein [Mesorhizobium sp. CO1-1-8]MBZ9772388.1 siderophore-interacting protein [Mesorhizobium sp. CO1-1-8]
MNDEGTIELNCEARLNLRNLPAYIDRIRERLESYDAEATQREGRVDFRFAFGEATFDMSKLIMRARASDRDGLARLKDLLATTVEMYAKEESLEISWSGDLADDTRLAQFREMEVVDVHALTPNMRRIRFSGENLARFGKFGGMHLRMLFPSQDMPDPIWPSLGANGLPVWPSDAQRPTARIYTIRKLDLGRDLIEVDFLIHPGEGVGSAWAARAAPGKKLGVMGPLGRPVRRASWFLLGADETGLPALARLLETLPAETKGIAFVEIADDGERHAIDNKTGIELSWLPRNGVPAGEDMRLADAIRTVSWPRTGSTFGWFAAEGTAARLVREHWRETLSLGRDETLAAAYWRRGVTGVMAA